MTRVFRSISGYQFVTILLLRQRVLPATFYPVMRRRITGRSLVLLTAAGWMAWSTISSGQAQNPARPTAPVSSPSPAATAAPRAVLDQYCIGCHNAKLRSGDLALDSIDPAQAAARPDVWEKVI